MRLTHKRRIGSALLKRLWKQRSLQAIALSGALFLIVFNVAPIAGLLMGFKDYKINTGFWGIFKSEWVGLKYFRELATDYNFFQLIRNTVVLSVAKMIFVFPMPIILAIMLNEIKSRKLKRLIQTVSYMPYFISWVVVAGFIVIFFNTQSGVVNQLLVNLGIVDKPVSFLGEAKYFLPTAVLSAIWKETGWWAIIFLAALAGLDPGLYEAAMIDGASRLQRILRITLPGIMPTVAIVLILAIGNIFGGGLGGSNFDQSFLLGRQSNRQYSDIIQTYVFRVGLPQGRYAYSTAIGSVQSLISVILILASNGAAKKVTGNGLF
jgi:putative aldouronate transport system permease protein